MKKIRSSAGQALTEFLVLALALIPLFLLMPIVAKYQDIAHSVQVASRYLAFDATTHNDIQGNWKEESVLANEVRRRFFSSGATAVITNDLSTAPMNGFWRDQRGSPLLPDPERDISISFGEQSGATHASAFDGARFDNRFTVSSLLGLRDRGIYTANVQVQVANLPAGLRMYAPFDRINLQIARSASLLLDSWTSLGPADTETRIASDSRIFPASALRSTAAMVDANVRLIEMGRVQGPRLGQLEFWRDVVPQDRLK